MNPLAVVILNWNLPHETIDCVESFQVGLPKDARIVVVDNASTDDSPGIFRAQFGESIDIIVNDRNLGFASGVNTAMRRLISGGAQSIFLANNDTTVAPDLLAQLLRTAETNTGAGIVGPVIHYHDDPDRIWRYGDRQHPWLPFIYPLSADHLARQNQEPFQVSYITGCGMLVRRDVFEKVGLFDDSYFMYFEDADFCRRARQAGFEIWVNPRAAMWHKISLSSRREKPQMRYYQSWGRANFYRSDPAKSRRWFAGIYLLARSFRVTVTDIFRRDWKLIRPGWEGTLDGFAGHPARLRP